MKIRGEAGSGSWILDFFTRPDKDYWAVTLKPILVVIGLWKATKFGKGIQPMKFWLIFAKTISTHPRLPNRVILIFARMVIRADWS